METGGLDLVSAAVVKFPLEVVVCRTALSIFRNISANDVLKTKLLQEGGLRLVLGCMSQHDDDKTLQVRTEGVVGTRGGEHNPAGFCLWSDVRSELLRSCRVVITGWCPNFG